VNILLLSLWTTLNKTTWEREVVAEDEFGRPSETHGFCSFDGALPYAIVIAIVDLGALSYAVYEAYVARDISTEFAESEYIFKAMSSILLVSVIAIPVAIIAKDDPIAYVFVVGGIICVICMSLLTLIFVPKVRFNRELKKNKRESTLRQNVHITWSSNDDNTEAAGSSAESKVLDRSGDNTESRISFELGSKVVDQRQVQEEMKAENVGLRDRRIKLEGSVAKLQNQRDVVAPNKDSIEKDLPRVAAFKPEPNTDSSVSEDDSGIGLKVIDRREMREQMKAENASLRQTNRKLKERVVVLKSQRNLFAPKEVPYKKKERRVSFEQESLAEAEALVSEAGSPESHSQQPSPKVLRYPGQNRADNPKVELTSSDRALGSLLCDEEYLGSLV
jgi:cell division protein FtsB